MRKQTSGTTNNLFSVHFVNANEGWAVGASNLILHTANGGATSIFKLAWATWHRDLGELSMAITGAPSLTYDNTDAYELDP